MSKEIVCKKRHKVDLYIWPQLYFYWHVIHFSSKNGHVFATTYKPMSLLLWVFGPHKEICKVINNLLSQKLLNVALARHCNTYLLWPIYSYSPPPSGSTTFTILLWLWRPNSACVTRKISTLCEQSGFTRPLFNLSTWRAGKGSRLSSVGGQKEWKGMWLGRGTTETNTAAANAASW